MDGNQIMLSIFGGFLLGLVFYHYSLKLVKRVSDRMIHKKLSALTKSIKKISVQLDTEEK